MPTSLRTTWGPTQPVIPLLATLTPPCQAQPSMPTAWSAPPSSVLGPSLTFPAHYLFMGSPLIVVQSLSPVWLFAAPWTAAHQASLSFTISRSLLKLMSIKSVMPSNPSHPLLSPSPAFNLSQHQSLFKWVSSSHQVAKVLEFQLQHQSFKWIFSTDFC